MKPGRPKWTRKVSRPALERIQAALAGGEDARAVYDRFNIGQYTITPRTFREWADVYLRDWEARQPEGGDAEAINARTLLDSLLARLQAAVDAGRLPDEKIGDAIHAAARALDSDFKRNADARAQKLFDAKAEKLKPVVSQAIAGAGIEGESKGIRPVLESLMRGEITLDEAEARIDGSIWSVIDRYLKGAA